MKTPDESTLSAIGCCVSLEMLSRPMSTSISPFDLRDHSSDSLGYINIIHALLIFPSIYLLYRSLEHE